MIASNDDLLSALASMADLCGWDVRRPYPVTITRNGRHFTVDLSAIPKSKAGFHGLIDSIIDAIGSDAFTKKP